MPRMMHLPATVSSVHTLGDEHKVTHLIENRVLRILETARELPRLDDFEFAGGLKLV